VAGGDVQNLPGDDVPGGGPALQGGREVAPGHFERPAANALMVLPKLPDPPASSGSGPGSGSGSASGSGSRPGTPATTPTTAVAGKVTVAGGGSAAPATGKLATPSAPAAPTSLSPSIDDILRNPGTKRPRRQTAKSTNGHKAKDGQSDDAAADAAIPDWNDITAALTPEAVAAGGQTDELSLAGAPSGHRGPGHDPVRMLLELAAAGMITTVLCGLQRARVESRPRPALWL
jgi:hypothetical protein